MNKYCNTKKNKTTVLYDVVTIAIITIKRHLNVKMKNCRQYIPATLGAGRVRNRRQIAQGEAFATWRMMMIIIIVVVVNKHRSRLQIRAALGHFRGQLGIALAQSSRTFHRQFRVLELTPRAIIARLQLRAWPNWRNKLRASRCLLLLVDVDAFRRSFFFCWWWHFFFHYMWYYMALPILHLSICACCQGNAHFVIIADLAAAYIHSFHILFFKIIALGARFDPIRSRNLSHRKRVPLCAPWLTFVRYGKEPFSHTLKFGFIFVKFQHWRVFWISRIWISEFWKKRIEIIESNSIRAFFEIQIQL